MEFSKEQIITISRSSSYHAGITPEIIVDTALRMSHGTGINSWTFRKLAAELGIATSVLYHHVGSKDALTALVVERILSTIPFPTTIMDWKTWFRTALYPARPILASYPGSAKWLVLHGPAFTGIAPVIDAGITSLQEAGFGDNAAHAYSVLFNTALLTISASDERLEQPTGQTADHAAMMEKFKNISQSSPGSALLIQQNMAAFTRSPEEAEAARENYYHYLIEALIDGLSHTINTN